MMIQAEEVKKKDNVAVELSLVRQRKIDLLSKAKEKTVQPTPESSMLSAQGLLVSIYVRTYVGQRAGKGERTARCLWQHPATHCSSLVAAVATVSNQEHNIDERQTQSRPNSSSSCNVFKGLCFRFALRPLFSFLRRRDVHHT